MSIDHIRPTPGNAGESATSSVGSAWKPILDHAVGAGRLEVDPDGLRRCIGLCHDHATAMGAMADRAQRELRVEALGIGEHELGSAQQLVNKFADKATGGGRIAYASSAVGMLREHECFARDMQATLERVLRAYEEQERVTADGLDESGGAL
ncbi:hypothetical protein [Rhodococcus sp. HNM0569]|uniref:hypothetical protein n=1 Tax=Rhodococcus sp. HNM0569 TaxID=2716340 RepID=UPI00146C3E26|nr:hypothetical protein [Rhodococcus sp. HNM0569]NLU84350.1 hypothetical protein [Rhodococcus sp. HNM0569]